MKKNTAGKTGLQPADVGRLSNFSPLADGCEPTDYERYRRISFYFEAVLQQTLETAGGWRPEEDFKAFLAALAAGCLAVGIPEEEAVRWSLIHLDLQGAQAEVRLLFRNQYRIGRFRGKKPDIPAIQSTTWRLEEFMRRRYEFRFNTWSEETEYRARQSFDFEFRPVTSRIMHGMVLNAALEGLRLSIPALKQYMASDRVPFFSPFEAYFAALPVWDGRDHIRSLAAAVPCRHKDWPSFFFRWFLGRVAVWADRATKPFPAGLIPWLYGPAGCGKGEFCLRLLPLEWRSFYASWPSASFADRGEEVWRRLALCRLSADVPGTGERLRHLGRRFAKSGGGVKVSCLLTGSSPSLSFALPRGIFLFPAAVDGFIRLPASLDYEQLYAQAYELVGSGERYWFTPEEMTAWAVSAEGGKGYRKKRR